jgi:hypothetical protein
MPTFVLPLSIRYLLLQLPFLGQTSFKNFRSTFLPKSLDGLVVDGGCGFTSAFEALVLTLVKHVFLEVAVDAGFVGICEAVLFFEVAVAEVVTVAGVDDCSGISCSALFDYCCVDLQSKPNGLSGEDEHPSELQSSPAGPACAFRLLMNWLIEMLKT